MQPLNTKLSKLTTIAVIASSLCLTACQTSISGKSSLSPAEESLVKLNEIQTLDLSGRIGYIAQDSRGSARFDFKSAGQFNYTLELISPVGSNMGRLEVLSGGATLRTDKGETYIASDARELLRNTYNIDVPAEQLRNVLLGTVKGEVLSYTAEGRPVQISVEGYNVVYKTIKDFKGYTIPTSLELSRNGSTVKIAVSDVYTIE